MSLLIFDLLFNRFAHSAGLIHLAVVDYLLGIIVCSDRTGQEEGQDGTGQRTGRGTEQRPGRRNHFRKRQDMPAMLYFRKYIANNTMIAGPAQPAQPPAMHHIVLQKLTKCRIIVV